MRSIPVTMITTKGEVPLTLQVAATPMDWETGYRGKPPPKDDHEGILFFFPAETRASFTMKGVPFDLELHAGGSSGRITGGCDLTANYPLPYAPSGVIRFAIELKSGWASRQGLPVRIALP